MPLRETAEKNREQFEISDAEFESKKGVFQKFENIGKVDYRQELVWCKDIRYANNKILYYMEYC